VALATLVLTSLLAMLAGACATSSTTSRTTARDKTAKGAGVGAAAGAAIGVLTGHREADEILAGAAIGGAIGAGVGAYMDSQEEKLARIPGTRVEQIGEDTLLVHFDSDLLFDDASAALSADARRALDEMAVVLNDYPKTAVVIQGHTDSIGSEESNQSLSVRRAEAVKNYLTVRGVNPERMASIGFGETSPVTTNETEAGRRQNRRVDVLLKGKAT
jgi:outer membrane protein OmpA-like peptidoglycan-associated protein